MDKAFRRLGRRGPVVMAALAALLSLAGPAAAQEARAPEGPVEFTIGTRVGGTPDVLMRKAAQILNEKGIVENPIVIQNRTGGSWAVSGNYVLSKEGDPNTIMVVAQPILTTPITQGIPTFYDKITPIGMFIQGGLTLAVQPDAPYNNLDEFFEHARNSSSAIRVAGAQAGSTDHMVTALVEKAGGVKLNYIPYEGGSEALASFLGGNVEMVVLPPVEALPELQAGKVKLIALLSEERRPEPDFADLPTAKEQGYDIVWGQSWGLAGPPNLDPAYVKFWDEAITKLLETEEWQAFAAESFLTSRHTGADKARAHMDQLHQQHLELLQELGLAKM